MRRRKRQSVAMAIFSGLDFITDVLYEQTNTIISYYMNLNNTITIDTLEGLDEKICTCIDQLGLLLDHIYKFSQRQREHYYDRIQSMKNRLIHLRTHLRETNINQTQQQYRQIWLNTHNLKRQINEYGSMNKRKSVSPLNESKTNISKNKYDEIMGIIVEKDECIENNNIKIQELEGVVRAYGKRECDMKQQIGLLKRELMELNSIQVKIMEQNGMLVKQRQMLYAKIMELQSLYSTHHQCLQLSTDEVDKLSAQLRDSKAQLRLKQSLCDNLTIQLRTIEEKHMFEVKELKIRDQNMKVREKEFKKELKEMVNEMNSLAVYKQEYFLLQKQNERIKEDKFILEKTNSHCEAQLSKFKQQYHQQLNKLTNVTEEREKKGVELQKVIDSLREEIGEGRKQMREKDKTIQYLQKQIKLVRQKLFELQERNAENKKQFSNWELLFTLKEEEIKNVSATKNKLASEVACLNKQLSSSKQAITQYQIQTKVIQQKNNEYLKVIKNQQHQQQSLSSITEEQTKQMERRSQMLEQLKRELEKAKKKYLRAKIQTIHNIREVII